MPQPATTEDRASDRSVLSDEHVGRRVIHGSALRGGGFVIANLLTAASAAILLRYLGVVSFGRYGTVLAVVGIVYGISDMGLTATGTREIALARTREESRDILGHTLGLRIAVTTVGVVGGVVFGLLAGYEVQLVLGIAIAGFGVLMQSVQAAMLMPLSVELRNGMLALNQVVSQATLLVGFVVLALAHAGLVPFFAVQIFVGVVVLAATPMMLAREHLVRPRWTPSRIGALGRIALPVAIGAVLGVLYLRILVIIMSLVSGEPKQVGYYVTSTRVMELIGALPFLVVSVMLPVIVVAARDDSDRLVFMTSRVAQVMALSGVLVALLVWTLAHPVVTLLGGHQYAPAASVLQIQGFATITIFFTAAWLPALMALNRLRSYWVASGAGILAVVVAGLILIPLYQATGAAVAAVVADVTLSGAMYLAVRRAHPGQWVSPGAMLRIGAAAAVAIGLGLIGGIPTVPRAVLVTGAFVITALVLGAVPSEMLDALRAVFARLRRVPREPAGSDG